MSAVEIKKLQFTSEFLHRLRFSQSDLPPTELLLLQGGDGRIALSQESGLNKYGCGPLPDPEGLAFGSSTASTISTAGFAAADRLRNNLVFASRLQSPAAIYRAELDRIRRTLITLCGLSDVTDLDVILGASGTDLHLIAAQAISSNNATRIIMIDPAETGRGVPLALSGRHFSTHSSQGIPAVEGSLLTEHGAIHVDVVSIRSNDGSPRSIDDIDAEVESLVANAAAMKQHVLLVLADSSKTGMIAPSPACAVKLRSQLPELLDVLIDACQFRISCTSLRGYIEHGFMVAVTGSKFLTGPTFSGAMFIPANIAHRLRNVSLSPALSAYSCRAEWPMDWELADTLSDNANFGLLLRWEAALEELKLFCSLSEEFVTSFITEFAQAIRGRLQNDPFFEPLPTPQLNRQPIANTSSWDQIPTIFPFLLCSPENGGKTPLSREKTMLVYQLLQRDLSSDIDAAQANANKDILPLRCQLGQPVECGARNGVPVSALRLCLSSRLIVEAGIKNNAARIIDNALTTLDKAAALILTTRTK
jgi:hypothetical protein